MATRSRATQILHTFPSEFSSTKTTQGSSGATAGQGEGTPCMHALGCGRCVPGAQPETKGDFREVWGEGGCSEAVPCPVPLSEFNSSLSGQMPQQVPIMGPLQPSSLLFTDLMPLDQRLPLPPRAGRRGNYVIYIGNGQDSMGTSSLMPGKRKLGHRCASLVSVAGILVQVPKGSGKS